MSKSEEDFLLGILVALQVVVISYDQPVIAKTIIQAVDWPKLKRFGLAQGGIDAQTIRKITPEIEK